MKGAAVTVLDQFVACLRQAATYNRHDLSSPRVILWTDGERLWSKIIPLLVDSMPELLILDDDPCSDRQGPSTRIRYILSRGDFLETPVIYLPGINRQAFRGAAGFPVAAKHLFALQFQGQFWSQLNGKDWTPSAFFSSEDGGLGLDLARDQETLEALAEQLEHIFVTKLEDMRARRLDAALFRGLVAKDPIRLLLQWMGAPEAFKKELKSTEWKAFKATCKKDFGFDPDKDGVITAAEQLIAGGEPWDQVWQRYSEVPKAFAGVRKALDLVQQKDLFDMSNERIPSNNLKQEETLRAALESLSESTKNKAVEDLTKLCEEHTKRATSLWASLGEAPLACAVAELSTLLSVIKEGIVGSDWSELAFNYLKNGWKVDAAAKRAYAAVRAAADQRALASALRVVYRPWLEEFAERVGRLASTYPNQNISTCLSLSNEPGTIVLFVDGLRCDIGIELQRYLEKQSYKVELKTTWSPLPTVTSSAKYAWLPLAEHLDGREITDGFEPVLKEAARPIKSQDFKKLLEVIGWSWVEASEIGDPQGISWTEVGLFDRYGHEQQAKVLWRIEEELLAVIQRVRELLDGGWKKVIVFTDHGWLLLPGGLPKVDLPRHLTVSKWGRCAIAKPEARHDFPQVSWFWGNEHAVVLAPGIYVFRENVEYSHGGLTIQETLIPLLTVTVDAGAVERVIRIESHKWAGLRLQVTLVNAELGTLVDVRTKPADASSSVLIDKKPKVADAAGKVSLLVDGDEHIGESAALVVLRGEQVVCKQPVTIGEQ